MLSKEYAQTLFVQSNEQLSGLVDGENSLDSVETSTRVQYTAAVQYLGQVYFYALLGGGLTQSLPNRVRPKDFHPVSNSKYWKLIGKTGDSGGGGGGGAQTVRGTGSPEGVVTGGESVGVFHYFDTSTNDEYRFFGVDGENTGWA